MMINSLYHNMRNFKPNLSFGSAVLNINSLSDSHGSLERLDTFYQNIEANKEEVIIDDSKKGNKNVLFLVGDWFMSGATGGYRSKKDANSHYFQIEFFNAFVDKMKGLCKGLTTYFVPGNHETDGGRYEFKRVLKAIKAKILMTNLDYNNSPLLCDEINNGKIVQKNILEIEDDKDPNKVHKALFLGINPVNMEYYQRDMNGINFINQPFKSQKKLTEKDFKETLDETIQLIEEFKQENPKGIVIIGVHTGADFAQKLAEREGNNISVIFNAHEHKNGFSEINGTKIIELSQNFKKYANVKFYIDDDDNLSVKIAEHYPFSEPHSKTKGYFGSFFDEIFQEDLVKEYKIEASNPDIQTLDDDNVRTTNSFLANFITDTILSEIQKTNPEVDIFGISSTAIRRSLPLKHAGGADNLRMLEVLGGIVEKDANIFKNEVSGQIFLDIIMDNLLFNRLAPERNGLIQYSGVIIDKKSLLKDYYSGKSQNELAEHIIIAKDNKPLDLEKTYTIANVEKYFIKSKNKLINETLYNEAEPLGLNARALFKEQMDENKDNLYAKCDVRIID